LWTSSITETFSTNGLHLSTHDPSPGAFAPPSPRKRGEGQLKECVEFVALRPACGEKVDPERSEGPDEGP